MTQTVRRFFVSCGASLAIAGVAVAILPSVQAQGVGGVRALPTLAPLRYEIARNPFVLPAVAAQPQSTPSPSTSIPAIGEGGAAGSGPTVVGVFVGDHPFATIQEGTAQRQVAIGDRVDGHTVLSIQMDGLLLDNGARLSANPLSAKYTFPTTAGGTSPTPSAVPPRGVPPSFTGQWLAPIQVQSTPVPSVPAQPRKTGTQRVPPSLPYGMTPPPAMPEPQ
ncbi:hypothetical protein EPN42_13045 [bacterium]|nr:MAG: hypothetical protein EPN42_13045 [bacterium]